MDRPSEHPFREGADEYVCECGVEKSRHSNASDSQAELKDSVSELLLSSEHPYACVVRYVAPASGLANALTGWAVEVKTKEGVTAMGTFQGDVPRRGMFRIVDLIDEHLILGADLTEITEVTVL